MNAITGFVGIVSLLLTLAGGGTTQQGPRKAGGGQQEYASGTTQPQPGITHRKAGEGQQEARLITPSKLATNHNETLVLDTTR